MVLLTQDTMSCTFSSTSIIRCLVASVKLSSVASTFGQHFLVRLISRSPFPWPWNRSPEECGIRGLNELSHLLSDSLMFGEIVLSSLLHKWRSIHTYRTLILYFENPIQMSDACQWRRNGCFAHKGGDSHDMRPLPFFSNQSCFLLVFMLKCEELAIWFSIKIMFVANVTELWRRICLVKVERASLARAVKSIRSAFSL